MIQIFIHVHRRGFTLIEALVSISIATILLAVTVPSAIEWIRLNRVKASAAELVTDIQLARAETVRRNVPVLLAFGSNALLRCYTVQTTNSNGNCDCQNGVGASCGAGPIAAYRLELKTVLMRFSSGVAMSYNQNVLFEAPSALPSAGATLRVDFDGGGTRQLRVTTNAAGRPQICAPAASTIRGYAAC